MSTPSKRHKTVFNASVSVQDLEHIEKSPEESQLILCALRKIPLTRDLPPQSHVEIKDIMRPIQYEENDIIIKEGDTGDRFFVLTVGHCLIFVGDRLVNEARPGDGFGDLALLFSQKRAATIRATERCFCYFLTAEHFKSFMMQARQAQIAKYQALLGQVEKLKSLSEQERYMLAQAMRPFAVKPLTDIITQGEDGDLFYVIEEGDVEVFYNQKKVADLHAGSYFGEAALLHNAKRNATIRAVGHVDCAVVDRETFINLIGKQQGLEDGRKNE